MRSERSVPWGFIALAAALLLAGALFVTQSGILGDDDDGDDDTTAAGTAVSDTATMPPAAAQPTSSVAGSDATSLTADATATVTTPAFALDCDATPQLSAPPSGAGFDPMFGAWFGDGSSPLSVAPLNFASFNPTLVNSGQHWYAEGPTLMFWHGTTQPVTVSATHADTNTTVDGGEAFLRGTTQSVEISFPEAGCWDVTATAPDAEATFTLAVAPQEQRPDVMQALSSHAAAPYAVPADCDATAWSGPSDPLNVISAAWWLTSPDAQASIGSRSGVLWAEEESILMALPADPETSQTHRLEAEPQQGGLTAQAETTLNPSGLQPAILTFAEPGCWDLTLFDGTTALANATVYVYPAACRRETDATPVPGGCTPPE